MDPIDRRTILAGAGLVGVAALSRMAKAGDLEPPQGPIMPTGKTLQQIHDRIARGGVHATPESRIAIQDLQGSPFAQYVIDQPGAYYLAGNITGVPGMLCIEVLADDVDIDGGGFTFIGVDGTSSCIHASGRRCLEIYDVAFSHWQGCCIDCGDCDDSYVSDIVFRECVCPPDPATGEGGAVCRLGHRCEVWDCAVAECTGGVIRVGHGGVTCQCECRGGDGGFQGGNDCVCEDNLIIIAGVSVGYSYAKRAAIIDNQRTGPGIGIVCDEGSCVESNQLTGSDTGIFLQGQQCCAEDNYLVDCATGIRCTSNAHGCLIDSNHITGSGNSAAGGFAIQIDQGSTNCQCTCNHLRSFPAGTSRVSIADGNCYGPFAMVAGVGDMSSVAAAGHPWANFLY